MKYKSTRGDVKGVTFEKTVFSGFTPLGGLFVPEYVPKITEEEFSKWKKFSYTELCFEICRKFISESEISSTDLKEMIKIAYSSFTHPNVCNITKCEIPILELFHGPTLSFKDYALSLLAQFIDYFLKKKSKKITIVVGTSGDTGSAAIQAVKDLSSVNIIVLYPKDRCSKTQELQIISTVRDNVHVFQVDGSSDDLDVPIKEIFKDKNLVDKYNVCSINSINWARIMIQTVHHFYGYFQSNMSYISIPTGACGNISSGIIASKMGLPIKFIGCVNENDIIDRCVRNGCFELNSDVFQTTSPSMDIQVPYNWERICYFTSNENEKEIKAMMEVFESQNMVKLNLETLSNIRSLISTVSITQKEVGETIKWYYENYGYILDPHTAVGVSGSKKLDKKALCVATASPLKFQETIHKIIGIEMKKLTFKEVKYEIMNKGENWENILRNKIVSLNEKK
eukprot:gene2375-2840_t